MASVSTQKKTGLRRVIFFDLSGRRSAIHVGKISMASAREIAGHVQHLVICRKSGTDCRRSTTDWVERIRQDWPNLANRLGEFGLAVGADAYCRDAAVASETARAFIDKRRAAQA